MAGDCMRREEAMHLLKEIMNSCDSFKFAESVSIVHDVGVEDYSLRAKWIPQASEMQCLNAIKLRYYVEIFEAEGYTVFRRLN